MMISLNNNDLMCSGTSLRPQTKMKGRKSVSLMVRELGRLCHGGLDVFGT